MWREGRTIRRATCPRTPRGRRRESRAPRRAACAALALLLSLSAFAQTTPQKAEVPARFRAALEQVSAEDMRGHLSFIASDALEGRKTPSRGLDIAAEYIAAQFRRAGLEPAGDDGGYFQTGELSLSVHDVGDARVIFSNIGPRGMSALAVQPEQLSLGVSVGGRNFWQPESAVSFDDAHVTKVAYGAPSALTREQVAGRVVLVKFPELQLNRLAAARPAMQGMGDFLARVGELGSPLVVAFDPSTGKGRGGGFTRFIDAESAGARPRPRARTPPVIFVHSEEGSRFFDSLPAGDAAARLNVNLSPPAQMRVRARNVAGILRGSDPALRDTYVIVSAHYDHIGVRPGCDASKEDCIFNGANDDGSGTVGVIELATALSKLNPRPRRSILFMTFFGEELGLVGSRYYGRHPLVPLAKTVAQVNMEQIGRTDDSEGPQVGTLAVTGFDFSDVGSALQRAGEAAGVRVYKHPTNSDAYFSRSDNQSLADAGVPAHTAGVAFDFPDYHAVGDEWSKIDYANMERVARAVGLAVLLIADDPREPRWNEQNPKTAAYVQAWKKLHGQ